MTRTNIPFSGLAAIVGAVLSILLTPVFASAYLEQEEESPTPLIDGLRSVVEPLLGFASVETVYRTYGLIYLVASLMMLYGFLALRARLEGNSLRVPHRGLSVSLIGWLMFVVGLIGDYVMGDAFGSVLHDISFLIEVLGILVLLIGTLMTGLGTRRSNLMPSWLAWLLVLALPLGVVGLILISHIPSGPMLGVSLASIGVGYTLLSGAPVSES